MHIVFLVCIFLILIGVSSFLMNIGVENWIVFFLMVFVYFATLIGPSMWYTYKSNNLRGIERFLKINRKKPLYSYPYLTKHGNKQQIEESLKRIMEKYHQPSLHHTYGAILAIHQGNNAALKEHAMQIGSDPLESYYLAYHAALKRKFDEVEELKKNIQDIWMHHALNAIVATIKGDHSTFEQESEEAVRLAKGIQKFSLKSSFERMGEK